MTQDLEEVMRDSLEGTFTTYTGNESLYSYDKCDPLQAHYANIRTKLRRAAVIASRMAAAAPVAPIPLPPTQTAILSLMPLSGVPMTDEQFKAGLSKMSHLLRLTEAVTGVSVDDIKSFRRGTAISRARQIFFWLCKQYTLCSYPQIGSYLGKDHTTAIYGAKKVSARLADYPELDKIKTLLGVGE